MSNFAKQANQYDETVGAVNKGYVRLLSTNIGTIAQQKLNGTVEVDAELWTAKKYETGDQVEDGLGNIYEYVQNNNGIEISQFENNVETTVNRTLASLLTQSPKLYDYQNPAGGVTFPDADAYLEGIEWWVLARSVNNRALLDGKPAVTTGRRGGLVSVYETDTPWDTFGLIRANCGNATIFATDKSTAEDLVFNEQVGSGDALIARNLAYGNAGTTRDTAFSNADTILSTARTNATRIYEADLSVITATRDAAIMLLDGDPQTSLTTSLDAANNTYNLDLARITKVRDDALAEINNSPDIRIIELGAERDARDASYQAIVTGTQGAGQLFERFPDMIDDLVDAYAEFTNSVSSDSDSKEDILEVLRFIQRTGIGRSNYIVGHIPSASLVSYFHFGQENSFDNGGDIVRAYVTAQDALKFFRIASQAKYLRDVAGLTGEPPSRQPQRDIVNNAYATDLASIRQIRDRAIEAAEFAFANAGLARSNVIIEYNTRFSEISQVRDEAFREALEINTNARNIATDIYENAISIANSEYNRVLSALSEGTAQSALLAASIASAVTTVIPQNPNRPTDLLITNFNWFLPPNNGKYYFFVILSESRSVTTYNSNDTAEFQEVVSVGQIVAGNREYIGETLENGWSLQKVDFSPKDRDDFGNINPTPRPTTYNSNINIILPTRNTQDIKIKFDDLLPVAPTLFWLTGIESNGDLVYGYLDDFEITPGAKFDERNLQVTVFGLV